MTVTEEQIELLRSNRLRAAGSRRCKNFKNIRTNIWTFSIKNNLFSLFLIFMWFIKRNKWFFVTGMDIGLGFICVTQWMITLYSIMSRQAIYKTHRNNRKDISICLYGEYLREDNLNLHYTCQKWQKPYTLANQNSPHIDNLKMQ